jgi:hypothetical protein
MFGGSGLGDSISATQGNSVQEQGGSLGTLLQEFDCNNTSLFGGAGNDTLVASGGTSIFLDGEDGSNVYQLIGSTTDPLVATASDLVTVGQSTAVIDGATEGINELQFPGAPSVTLDLSNFTTNDPSTESVAQQQALAQAVYQGVTLSLVGAFENVDGSANGDDVLTGNSASNLLTPGLGHSILRAGSGPATLVGGSGQDILVGGVNTTFRFTTGGTHFVTAGSGDTLDFQQFPGTVNLSLMSFGQQLVNSNSGTQLILGLNHPMGISGVRLSPQGDTITGNSVGDSFTIGGTGAVSITNGGGADQDFFVGSQFGPTMLSFPGGGTGALNFFGMGGPVSLDLNQAFPQPVDAALGLTLNLPQPNQITSIIGTPFSDTLAGSNGSIAPNQTILGGGGLDSLVAGSGNDMVEAGVNQVVLLDFDTFTQPGDYVYTAADRAAIVAGLQRIYGNFQVQFIYAATPDVVAQALAQAEAASAITGGQFITVNFNDGAAGGVSSLLNIGHTSLGGTSEVNINPLLGGVNQPAFTEANAVALSTEVAAHELGHAIFGLRHYDAFGPIGTGVYSVYNADGKLVAGIDPSQFIPSLPASSNGSTATASETPRHVMASPDADGITLFDSIGQSAANPTGTTYFGEREALKAAFDEAGSTVLARGSNLSMGTAQPLVLQGVADPNTLQPGDQNYLDPTTGQQATFSAAAVAVVGFLDPGSQSLGNPAVDHWYSFAGRQGDLMNFELSSASLTGNPKPFDTVLYIRDNFGNVLVSNDDSVENTDSRIFDYVLPYTGQYYIQVDSFTPDGVVDYTGGNYYLFMTRWADGPSLGVGNTIVGGSGNDTLIGSAGNDTITFAPEASGNYVVQAGQMTNVLNETNLTGAATIALAGNVLVQNTDTWVPGLTLGAVSPAVPLEGQLLTLPASAIDTDAGANITFSLGSDAPDGAGVTTQRSSSSNPGEFDAVLTWVPPHAGTFTFTLLATDSSGKQFAQSVTLVVGTETPAVSITTTNDAPVTALVVHEGDTVNLQGLYQVPGTAVQAHIFAWSVDSANASVTSGTDQNFSFVPTDDGIYQVTFEVTDDEGASNSVVLTVDALEITPSVSVSRAAGNPPITALTVNEGQAVSLHGDFTDPGAAATHVLSWTITTPDGNTNYTNVSGAASQDFSFVPTDDGSYTVTFTVSEGDGNPLERLTKPLYSCGAAA